MNPSRTDTDRSAHPAVDYWQSTVAWWDVVTGSHASARSLESQAEVRAQALVRFALSRSAVYRQIYGGVGDSRSTPLLRDLPRVGKAQLMNAFDDWVTDAAVTYRGVQQFLSDPGRVGEAFLGRYAVWTSSGTTGEPGVFVHDAHALAVYDALEAVRFRGLESPFAVLSSLLIKERYAMVGATGGHFAGTAAVARIRMMSPWLASHVRMFSIMDPLRQLTDALNEYQPTLLATYPSSALLLAREAERGALRIPLREVWAGGESLCGHDRELLAQAFGCPVRDDYGSSEFLPIAFGCAHGAMHLNADWVVLEPVDRDFRPVPPGERSYTVLLTNLANRVQPLIRYDLGDSVTMLAEPCPCGSRFPAMRVEGRRDDVLALRAEDGTRVALLPLALATVLEEEGQLFRFQLIQTGPASLSLRFDAPAAEREAAWRRAENALLRYMTTQGLSRIDIEPDPQPPAHDWRSGKCRRVIALAT
jgi:phenylacetate-CoA ligase